MREHDQTLKPSNEVNNYLSQCLSNAIMIGGEPMKHNFPRPSLRLREMRKLRGESTIVGELEY